MPNPRTFSGSYFLAQLLFIFFYYLLVSLSCSFLTQSLTIGLLWGLTLGNLFSTHIHCLKASGIGMCFATLLSALPPTYPLIILLGVLGETRLAPVSSPAFWEGLFNGKRQQEIGGKKEDLGYFFIPYAPHDSVRFC